MIKIKDIKQEGQYLRVTVDLPDAIGADDEPFGQDFSVLFHVAAIGSRMVMYNLATPEEALKSLVLEQARSTNKKLPNPENKEEAITYYEKDVKKMEIDVDDLDKINALLDDNLDTIREAIVRRLPEESDVAE